MMNISIYKLCIIDYIYIYIMYYRLYSNIGIVTYKITLISNYYTHGMQFHINYLYSPAYISCVIHNFNPLVEGNRKVCCIDSRLSRFWFRRCLDGVVSYLSYDTSESFIDKQPSTNDICL